MEIVLVYYNSSPQKLSLLGFLPHTISRHRGEGVPFSKRDSFHTLHLFYQRDICEESTCCAFFCSTAACSSASRFFFSSSFRFAIISGVSGLVGINQLSSNESRPGKSSSPVFVSTLLGGFSVTSFDSSTEVFTLLFVSLSS